MDGPGALQVEILQELAYSETAVSLLRSFAADGFMRTEFFLTAAYMAEPPNKPPLFAHIVERLARIASNQADDEISAMLSEGTGFGAPQARTPGMSTRERSDGSVA